MRTSAFTIAALFACAMAPAPAAATGISGNFIVGQWGNNPVVTGCVADAVNRSQLTCTNNASTAIYTIANAGINSGPLAQSTLHEGGDLFPQPGDGPIFGSTLTFTGGTIPATHDTVPFVIGGISFTNGATYDGTEVFADTLSLYASNGFTAQFIGSELVQFNETSNTGAAAQNADYVTFSGLAGRSFEVYEQATATGSVMGLVVGDPMVVLTSFTLDPGQGLNGFVGADPPLPLGTPEPAGLTLIGSGLLGLCALRRRQRAIR